MNEYTPASNFYADLFSHVFWNRFLVKYVASFNVVDGVYLSTRCSYYCQSKSVWKLLNTTDS